MPTHVPPCSNLQLSLEGLKEQLRAAAGRRDAAVAAAEAAAEYLRGSLLRQQEALQEALTTDDVAQERCGAGWLGRSWPVWTCRLRSLVARELQGGAWRGGMGCVPERYACVSCDGSGGEQVGTKPTRPHYCTFVPVRGLISAYSSNAADTPFCTHRDKHLAH